MQNQIKTIIFSLFLIGCAGFQRDCNSFQTTNFGGDWIIVQYKFDGAPINCWKLNNTAVSNENATDGIYWLEPSGHLVHISGWYNRVQVSNNDFAQAASSIGVDIRRCKNGAYLTELPASKDE